MVMRVNIKRMRPGVPAPSYGREGDAGLDIPSAVAVTVYPGKHAKIPTGWAFEIPAGFEGQIRSRSGLATKYRVTELTGTIDSNYRGEVHVSLINLGDRDLVISPGDRIAQIVISPVLQADLVEVDELSSTERGACGFGSSG